MTGNRYLNIAIGTGLLLLIPLFLTIRDGGIEGKGWNWGPLDFVVMGALVFATGVALDFAWRRLRDPVIRLFACAVIVLALFLIWAELAVDAISQAVAQLF
ncbi:hypothetical protein [Pelagibacterium halotolerans]|uniref:Transmembrane protein n=1 Tax=Pelagibacterium halotolerans (strain DSM 22347 / JCM 15775 / CGMCC 1.7692 / B2) TaxID=1082931 RepID=G4RAH0_PELHB|nr:hypothetical protein [Pelagibacterium halotolerans]AEQ51520.1 hypothetical protein KKY_1501 [Pelagibacterium halotolerans B2]QJR18643.1 hypothetical protein HKM20_09465 [Pelagibacterium halotolerans]SEA15793.1 hypothetical protein SAMN05428936_102138 [Pelagibacterium halotolerans]